MVVRGGYGLFFVPRNIQGNGDGAIEAFRDTPYVASIDGGLTPANRIGNPFPQGILPPLNDRDPLANVGAQIQAQEVHLAVVNTPESLPLEILKAL